MRYLIIFLLMITGCSNGGGSDKPEQTGVAVFCDSIGATHQELIGWPERLNSLITEDVYYDCRIGERLDNYSVKKAIIDSGIKYRYGVLALGFNDIAQGEYLGNTLDEYERKLSVLSSFGFEPVCVTYSYKTIVADKVNQFNDGILLICGEKGYKIITSTDQLFDGVHPTNAGSMETAENAWRVLY